MNGILLDTNALMFLAFRSDAMAERRVAGLGEVARHISQVCAIEMAIKHGLGKLALPPSYQTSFVHGFEESIRELGADLLPLELSHIEVLNHLPLHHRDPFDRMIIAQALAEDLTVVTRDRAFGLYPGLDVYEI